MTRTKNPALSLPASTRFTTRFVRFNCLACAAPNLASCRLSGRGWRTDYKDGWPHQSAQYQKAMRASFDWALWPPQKENYLVHDSVLILRDGTELPSGGSAIGYRPDYKGELVRTQNPSEVI